VGIGFIDNWLMEDAGLLLLGEFDASSACAIHVLANGTTTALTLPTAGTSAALIVGIACGSAALSTGAQLGSGDAFTLREIDALKTRGESLNAAAITFDVLGDVAWQAGTWATLDRVRAGQRERLSPHTQNQRTFSLAL